MLVLSAVAAAAVLALTWSDKSSRTAGTRTASHPSSDRQSPLSSVRPGAPPTADSPGAGSPAAGAGTTNANDPLAVDLPPPGDGALPQTTAKPSADTPTFRAQMAALWRAVITDQPALAMPAFFPESAYRQVKALANDDSDWNGRLLGHFALDVAATHRLLGSGGAEARLIETLVPSDQAAWIAPGSCSNKLGYWHVPGARLVYEQDGQQRSIGIASLISWRGIWYVVHFGSVLPPAGQGVVDAPAQGTGAFGPPGGC